MADKGQRSVTVLLNKNDTDIKEVLSVAIITCLEVWEAKVLASAILSSSKDLLSIDGQFVEDWATGENVDMLDSWECNGWVINMAKDYTQFKYRMTPAGEALWELFKSNVRL